jgi:biopolymer transport protein ExbB
MIFLADVPVVSQVNDPYISLLELLTKGGIIMVPIFLLSLITVFVFSEKLMYISKNGKVLRGFSSRLIDEISRGQMDEAVYLCRSNNSVGRIFEDAISMVGKPVKEIESVMETSANNEVARMERHTGYLGIIAGIAPMLGFVGTIAGVIKIFYNISLSDNISIGIIADGLYQKMITSGSGLIVGIIAYVCYHLIQMMIDRFTQRVSEESLVFIKSLQK